MHSTALEFLNRNICNYEQITSSSINFAKKIHPLPRDKKWAMCLIYKAWFDTKWWKHALWSCNIKLQTEVYDLTINFSTSSLTNRFSMRQVQFIDSKLIAHPSVWTFNWRCFLISQGSFESEISLNLCELWISSLELHRHHAQLESLIGYCVWGIDEQLKSSWLR